MIRSVIAMLIAMKFMAAAEDFQGSNHPLEYEQDPVNYSASRPTDAVAALQARIESGELKLPWDEKFGYLPALLDALKISRASQMLVFSKTSQQRKLISPGNPRAIYFNDDVYLGYVPGAPMIEISAADPHLGGTFYTLEQEKVRKPKLTRSVECLSCHGGQRSLGVPGHFIRSIPVEKTGELIAGGEVRDMDHTAPIKERWAGWYVTGSHGNQRHRGNLIGAEEIERAAKEPHFRGNLRDLSGLLELDKYPVKGSDIVALMILQHQAHMHNYIARLNIEARQMFAIYGHTRYLRPQVDAFLRYLLFTEEQPLTQAVSGNAEFAQAFTSRAIRDSKGRSMRDLDLKTRMFQYPCSFLIYSADFDAMAAPIKETILQKLHDILTGKNNEPQFARRTGEERAAILEILRGTKKNLPAYWKN